MINNCAKKYFSVFSNLICLIFLGGEYTENTAYKNFQTQTADQMQQFGTKKVYLKS